MKQVQIVKAFTLTHDDGTLERFNPGVHEMDDKIADHWYVIAHSNNPGRPKPAPGTPEYAKEEARKASRRKLLDAAAEEEAEAAAEEAEQQQIETQRRRVIKDVTTPPKAEKPDKAKSE